MKHLYSGKLRVQCKSCLGNIIIILIQTGNYGIEFYIYYSCTLVNLSRIPYSSWGANFRYFRDSAPDTKFSTPENYHSP